MKEDILIYNDITKERMRKEGKTKKGNNLRKVQRRIKKSIRIRNMEKRTIKIKKEEERKKGIIQYIM